jgi:hypothetical protein
MIQIFKRRHMGGVLAIWSPLIVRLPARVTGTTQVVRPVHFATVVGRCRFGKNSQPGP